jgi:hypothetical protein
MKAILEFDLSDNDDKMDFARANKSLDLTLAMWEILYNTRKKIEWDLESRENVTKEDLYEIIDNIYSRFWGIVDDHNIDFEEIIV